MPHLFSLPQLFLLLLLFHEFVSLHRDYEIPTSGDDLCVLEHTISVLFLVKNTHLVHVQR